MGNYRMSSVITAGKDIVYDSLSEVKEDAIALYEKYRDSVMLSQLLNPFDPYLFTIYLYWYLCFKLDQENKIIKEETYYCNILKDLLKKNKNKINEFTTLIIESSLINNFYDIQTLIENFSEPYSNPKIDILIDQLYENDIINSTLMDNVKNKLFNGKKVFTNYIEIVNRNLPQ